MTCDYCISPDPATCGEIHPCECDCHRPRTHEDLVAHAAAIFGSAPGVTTTQQEWKAAIYAQFKDLWADLPITERLGNAYRAAAQGACLTREPYRTWWEEMADVDLPALQEEWERRGLLV